MERKKWWASLIAVAVGLALSVGSASAYERGDFAEGGASANGGKLIPYYMAGDNLATIIGVENQAGLNGDNTATSGQVSIIEVRVLSAAGAVQATGQLCLASNQFGYAVLREEMMMDDGMMDDEMMVTLMVGVGDQMATITGMMDETTTGVSGRAGSSVNMTSMGSGIASMGYVVLSDLGTFTTNPIQEATDTDMTNDGCDSQGALTANTSAKFAAWTILQDVGEGSFFGTEIPTATVNNAGTLDDPTAETYALDRLQCGTATDCRGLIATNADKMVTARFDNNMENMSESMVYVWMDTSTDFDATTGMRAPRSVVAMAYCEGAATANRVMLDLPDRINMIDGSEFGCDARGTVQFTVVAADVGNVMAVWSHISQMGGGFRMNFAGYEDIVT